jgi:hypothetical protein
MKKYERAGRLFRLLGWLSLIFGAIAIAIPLLTSLSEISQAPIGSLIPLLSLVVVVVGMSIFQLKVGAAIKEHKDWGRTAGIILGIIQLIGFPIGTIIGAYILWCLIKGWNE